LKAAHIKSQMSHFRIPIDGYLSGTQSFNFITAFEAPFINWLSPVISAFEWHKVPVKECAFSISTRTFASLAVFGPLEIIDRVHLSYQRLHAFLLQQAYFLWVTPNLSAFSYYVRFLYSLVVFAVGQRKTNAAQFFFYEYYLHANVYTRETWTHGNQPNSFWMRRWLERTET